MAFTWDEVCALDALCCKADARPIPARFLPARPVPAPLPLLTPHPAPTQIGTELDADTNELLLRVQALGKLEVLTPYLAGDQLRLATPQVDLVEELIQQMVAKHHEGLRKMEEERMAQGGPRVLQLVSEEPSTVDPETQEALAALAARQAQERIARYNLTHLKYRFLRYSRTHLRKIY